VLRQVQQRQQQQNNNGGSSSSNNNNDNDPGFRLAAANACPVQQPATTTQKMAASLNGRAASSHRL
jgi:hypothetical protein